jgi:predicted AAA+ superfamily ATPase
MYPLSLQERGIERPSVCLGTLLDGKPFSAAIDGQTSVTFDTYLDEVFTSGLPALRGYSPKRHALMLDSYLDNLLTRDFKQQGIQIRQPAVLRRWLTAYAAAIATDADYSKILDASTSGEGEKPSAKTTISFREALATLWLIDELSAWLDGEEYFSRLKKTPKHYLGDAAFAARLLGITKDDLLGTSQGAGVSTRFDERYGNIAGRLFEALVFQSLRVYASVNEARLSYLGTHSGNHEIDFILQRDRRIIAIEVKMAPSVTSGDVRHLVWLKRTLKDRLADALIITTGRLAYRRPEDGIAVVPAALLGA